MTETSQRKKFELCKELSEATKEYSTEKVANEAARKQSPFDIYVGPHKAQDRWIRRGQGGQPIRRGLLPTVALQYRTPDL